MQSELHLSKSTHKHHTYNLIKNVTKQIIAKIVKIMYRYKSKYHVSTPLFGASPNSFLHYACVTFKSAMLHTHTKYIYKQKTPHTHINISLPYNQKVLTSKHGKHAARLLFGSPRALYNTYSNIVYWRHYHPKVFIM